MRSTISRAVTRFPPPSPAARRRRRRRCRSPCPSSFYVGVPPPPVSPPPSPSHCPARRVLSTPWFFSAQFFIPAAKHARKNARRNERAARFCRVDPRVVILAAESWDSLNRAFAQVNYPSPGERLCLPYHLARGPGGREKPRNAYGSDYPYPRLYLPPIGGHEYGIFLGNRVEEAPATSAEELRRSRDRGGRCFRSVREHG